MVLENHSLKRFCTAYYMLCYLVYIIFPLISRPDFSMNWLLLVCFTMYVRWIEIHYETSVSFAAFLLWYLCLYILNALPLWKINFYMSAFDWLRINNKYDFRSTNRFAQREFFKSSIRKITNSEIPVFIYNTLTTIKISCNVCK